MSPCNRLEWIFRLKSSDKESSGKRKWHSKERRGETNCLLTKALKHVDIYDEVEPSEVATTSQPFKMALN